MSTHGALAIWCQQAKACCSCFAHCAGQQEWVNMLLFEVVMKLPVMALGCFELLRVSDAGQVAFQQA